MEIKQNKIFKLQEKESQNKHCYKSFWKANFCSIEKKSFIEKIFKEKFDN